MKSGIKLNTVSVGLIAGLLLPLLTFSLIGVIGNHGRLFDFVRILNEIDRVASIISLSVIPNLLLFFVFIWTNRLFAARGVLFSTFIFAALMLIFKYA